ncbi:MAG TPA: hypothetical protein VLD37_04165 [Candidatus Bilamarchaeum sp.]|nr:hypothetical protein [Candidatus Bilamarchaeum sp.]
MAQRMRETPANEFVGKALLGVAPPQQVQRIIDDFFRLDAARLSVVTGGMKPLPPNASQEDRERAALRLYQRLVADRPGGIAYENSGNRMPKSPGEIIRPPMRADCDELAMLFIAAARALNIDTAGMSLGAFNLHTNQAGVSGQEPHAALFVSGLNGRNYIMDFAFPNGPWQVRDFSPATVSSRYRGLTISNGVQIGHTVISATPTGEYRTLGDIAAYGLIDRATTMGDRLGTGSISAPALLAVMDVLSRASGVATSEQLKLRIAQMYATLGEAGIANRHMAAAARAFTEGTAVFGSLPAAVQRANLSIGYRLGAGTARGLESGKSTRARARQMYDDLMRLDPSRQAAYEGAYRIRNADLDADIKANRRTEAQRGINEIAAMLRAGIRNSGSDVSMMTELQGYLDTVLDRARAGGYAVPAASP